MPIAVPLYRARDAVSIVPNVSLKNACDAVARPATVLDVDNMSALINYYASDNVMLARGPQYLYQHIQDYIVVTAPDVSGKPAVIGCGALHVLWEDLAEIRSIAVHHQCGGLGIGQMMVASLLERCARLRIPRAFVFTLAPGFFKKCGFSEFDRNDLPPVVWVECSKCPKFYRCDEIGMMKSVALA